MPNKRDANKIKTMSDTTAPTVGSAAHCSAATVREALQRCATMDDGFAHSALMDAGKCEKSDHPAIRERASEMKLRADTYKLRAARYRAALDWLVG